MGDEQQGDAGFGLQAPEQVQNLGADGNVEGGHRLVGDNQLGTQGQGAGDADALALTAGELVRVTRGGSSGAGRLGPAAGRLRPGLRSEGTMSCTRSGSSRIPPMLMRGLSDANGS